MHYNQLRGAHRVRWAARTMLLAAMAGAVLALGAPQASAAEYPSPPYDFSHPTAPHPTPWFPDDQLFSPSSGKTDRPMLVVYVGVTDLPPDPAADETFLSRRFFGGFPSAKGYFETTSFGELVLSPAPESNGTHNDGVIIVNSGKTYAEYVGTTIEILHRELLDRIEPFVDFTQFDTNPPDGRISARELVVVHMRQADPALGDAENCGAARQVEGPGKVDGKDVSFAIGGGTSAANLMTYIHEIGHLAFDYPDMYGYGPGRFDITGPTCNRPDSLLFGPSATWKTHLGWITPTVVSKDGFYDVRRADLNREAFILYDPDRGTDDYFIVENRVRQAGTYEQSIKDEGLVIWRMDDTKWASGNDDVRWFEIMRPDGAKPLGCPNGCSEGTALDAWDPSDPQTPQRTMARSWRDGTHSKVAVRAVGARDDTIRAYFDVRGPGILVDPLDAEGRPQTYTVVPGESREITFKVMNTGEAPDNFEFTVTNRPVGWSATKVSKTLAAGEKAAVTVHLTPTLDAAEGVYGLRVHGRSLTNGTVASTAPVNADVRLHATTVVYDGLKSEFSGQPAGFAAMVRDAGGNLAPVAGARVTFTLSDGANTQTTTAVSDAEGRAVASPVLGVPAGDYTVTAVVDRTGKHASAKTAATYTVKQRPVTLTYIGDASAEYSDPAHVAVEVKDALNGTAVSGYPVLFEIGDQTATATSDASGVVHATIVLTQPAGEVTVTALSGGGPSHEAKTVSAPFTIDEEDLTFAYTGEQIVAAGTDPVLTAIAVEEPDGSPGDLSRALAHFLLTPTLTSTSYSFTAPVAADGTASVMAADLPVDLWTVSVSVPAANTWWEGGSAPVELVVFDPDTRLNGGGWGLDSQGSRVRLTVNGHYDSAGPRGEAQVCASSGCFRSGAFDWIVRVGGVAIVQAAGEFGRAPANMRLRVDDAGEPPANDTFEARLVDDGAALYSSGVVSFIGGNVQVR